MTIRAIIRRAVPAVLTFMATVAPMAAGPLEDLQHDIDERLGCFLSYSIDAAKLCRKWADGGDQAAMNHLGSMYFSGRGLPQNYMEAAKWFRKAAERGDATAQFTTGEMYERGLGVSQNYVEAAQWYRKAADQGDSAGQYGLGMLYFAGNGVPQDFMQAEKWLNLAASTEQHVQQRSRAVKARDLLKRMMSSEQIAEAQRLASEWKPVAEITEAPTLRVPTERITLPKIPSWMPKGSTWVGAPSSEAIPGSEKIPPEGLQQPKQESLLNRTSQPAQLGQQGDSERPSRVAPKNTTAAAGSAPAEAETVDVKYRGPVDLAPFDCQVVTQSSFIHRVCYDERESYMLIELGEVYYHYCEVDKATFDEFLAASSLGGFYNERIKGHGGLSPFDCRTHRVPIYN